MRKMTALLTAILFAFVTSISAANSTFIDYQNYNHGYCPSCNYEPCVCDPPPIRMPVIHLVPHPILLLVLLSLPVSPRVTPVIHALLYAEQIVVFQSVRLQ